MGEGLGAAAAGIKRKHRPPSAVEDDNLTKLCWSMAEGRLDTNTNPWSAMDEEGSPWDGMEMQVFAFHWM